MEDFDVIILGAAIIPIALALIARLRGKKPRIIVDIALYLVVIVGLCIIGLVFHWPSNLLGIKEKENSTDASEYMTSPTSAPLLETMDMLPTMTEAESIQTPIPTQTSTIAPIASESTIHNGVVVPNTVGMAVEEAKQLLKANGLEPLFFWTEETNGKLIEVYYVISQSIPEHSIVPFGTQIEMEISDLDALTPETHTDYSENQLVVLLQEYSVSINGLSGRFEYSRELTNEEKDDWSFGGELITAFKEDYTEMIHVTSTIDGSFEVNYCEDIPFGYYIFILYLYINGGEHQLRIPIDINS